MLNHSCVQCRAKKLGCDGQTPCSNCQRKGLEDQCRRVIRKARPRKSRQAKRARIGSDGIDVEEMTTSPPSIVNSHADGQSSSLLLTSSNELLQATSSGSSDQTFEETLLRLARDALGDLSICEDLVKHVYYWKISSLAHACIHLPTVLDRLNRIFDPSDHNVKLDDVTMCMMTIALSLQYMTQAWSPANLVKRVENMSTELGPRARQRLLWELTSKCVQHRIKTGGERSLEQIQTIILLLIYDQDDETTREQMIDYAIRSAQKLQMHRIEDQDRGSLSQELSVRAWWFLVCQSWLTSLSQSTYSISPSHFSTRLPIQVEEFDKQPLLSRPTNPAFRPSQYSLIIIKLASMIRKLVDLRLEGRDDFQVIVENEFNQFCQDLPTSYGLASVNGIDFLEYNEVVGSRRTAVERWIVHQQLFHAYLEFQRLDQLDSISYSCLYLANHILDIQQQVRAYCCIVDSLRINVTNVVKASFILILDLIQQSTHQRHSAMTRSVTLGKIQQALQKCKTTKAVTHTDFDLVQSMLRLEEQRWNEGMGTTLMTTATTATKTTTTMTNNNTTESTSASILDGTPILSSNEIGTPISALSIALPAWEDINYDLSTVMLPSDGGLFPLLSTKEDDNAWQNLYQSLIA